MATGYKIQRERMVEKQLISRDIKDKKVLEVFLNLERHLFIEESLWDRAYADSPLPIGKNQTISQPYIVALMAQEMKLKGTERVLEIGTGSGYQSAVLALLASQVFTVERHAELAQRSRKLFELFSMHNIAIRIGDGTIGWKEFAPYDRIVVTAAAPNEPKSLLNQLIDGGKLIIPVGQDNSQILCLFTKKGDKIKRKEICRCSFVPLIGIEGWKDR